VASFRSRGRPRFRWAPGVDLWGPQTFQVQVDGRVVGTTRRNALVPARRLAGGRHHWRVVALDRRGQASPSARRALSIASAALRLSVRVSGSRRAGSPLRIVARVRGRLDRIAVSYGDGTRAARRPVSRHRYRRGTYTLTVRAFDPSGNFVEKRVRLRIT